MNILLLCALPAPLVEVFRQSLGGHPLSLALAEVLKRYIATSVKTPEELLNNFDQKQCVVYSFALPQELLLELEKRAQGVPLRFHIAEAIRQELKRRGLLYEA